MAFGNGGFVGLAEFGGESKSLSDGLSWLVDIKLFSIRG
jgi:hypothetical protein